MVKHKVFGLFIPNLLSFFHGKGGGALLPYYLTNEREPLFSAQEGDSRGKVIVGSECLGSRNLPSGILQGYHFQPKKPLVYFWVFYLASKRAFKVCLRIFDSTSYQKLAAFSTI